MSAGIGRGWDAEDDNTGTTGSASTEGEVIPTAATTTASVGCTCYRRWPTICVAACTPTACTTSTTGSVTTGIVTTTTTAAASVSYR